jgi:CheY-like chemotaxis protein
MSLSGTGTASRQAGGTVTPRRRERGPLPVLIESYPLRTGGQASRWIAGLGDDPDWRFPRRRLGVRSIQSSESEWMVSLPRCSLLEAVVMDRSMDRPRILIADDNQQNVELLEAHLAGLDCEILTASNGEETLRAVEEHRPDLVLLDVMMPKLSGFEVCKRIRAEAATRDTLILMVTALNEPADFERGVQAGTDDFLTKPVNKLELLCRVKSLLRVRHLKTQLERTLAYLAEVESASRSSTAVQ